MVLIQGALPGGQKLGALSFALYSGSRCGYGFVGLLWDSERGIVFELKGFNGVKQGLELWAGNICYQGHVLVASNSITVGPMLKILYTIYSKRGTQ